MGRGRILYEGTRVGVAGAVAIAIWFFLYDLASATPFRTPALLGAALFEGLRDPALLRITPGVILKYTAVHGLVFLVFSVAAAGLFTLIDRDRPMILGVFMLFCCFEVAAFLAMMVLGSRLLDTLPPGAILGGNFVAAMVMLAILVRDHNFSLREAMASGE